MGIKFKKTSVGENSCIYGLIEDIDSLEWKQLHDWLDTHCPDEYMLDNMTLIIKRQNELFFELAFEIAQ